MNPQPPAGVAVHSSSGNRGNDHTARVRANGTGGGPDGVNLGGPALPGCPYNPNNVVAIAPGGDTTFDINLTAGMNAGNARLTLQWSEPRAIFPTAGQGGFTDLDLFVMDAALTQCIAVSAGAQADGVGDTIEQVSIPVAANTTTAAKIIVNVAGTSSAVATPLLDLRWRNNIAEIDATTRAGSNDPDKNYAGIAYSIGAVRATDGALRGYSSAGPGRLGTHDYLRSDGPAWSLCGNGRGRPTALAIPGFGFPWRRWRHRFWRRRLWCPPWAALGQEISVVPPLQRRTPRPVMRWCSQVVGPAADPDVVRERLARTAIDYNDPANSPGEGPGEDPVTGAGLLDCLAAVIEADVSIAKSDDPDPVHAGENLTYTLTVTNNGPDNVGGIVVTDTLPASVTYISDTGGCDTSALPVLTCDVGTLSSGASVDFTILVAIDSDAVLNDPDGTAVITNTASVEAVGFDPDLDNNSVTEGTFVDSSADLLVSKLCKPDTEPALVGETGTCTIFVDNLGPSDADNVVVVDSIASDGIFDLLNADVDVAGGSCNPSSQNGVLNNIEITCDGFDLPAGERATITIEVTSDDTVDVNDIVTVDSDTPDPDPSNNSASGALSFIGVADLAITKSDSPDPVTAGTNLTYVLDVSNIGPSNAVNVLVEDQVPAGTSMVSAEGNDWHGFLCLWRPRRSGTADRLRLG